MITRRISLLDIQMTNNNSECGRIASGLSQKRDKLPAITQSMKKQSIAKKLCVESTILSAKTITSVLTLWTYRKYCIYWLNSVVGRYLMKRRSICTKKHHSRTSQWVPWRNQRVQAIKNKNHPKWSALRSNRYSSSNHLILMTWIVGFTNHQCNLKWDEKAPKQKRNRYLSHFNKIKRLKWNKFSQLNRIQRLNHKITIIVPIELRKLLSKLRMISSS